MTPAWSLELATARLMPTPSIFVSTAAALIAEFGGQLYVSIQHAQLDRDGRYKTHFDDDGNADRVEFVEDAVTLSCDCGASVEWIRSPAEVDAYAWLYFRPTEKTDDPRYHLTIVRTPRSEPPCEHWSQIPLTLAAQG